MTLPDHVIATNIYGRYCVPRASMERPAAQTVLRGKVWEKRLVALMRANCGTGDIVHAGAYFGDMLPGLSQALAPGAHLWTFEPSRDNHACATRTVEWNGLTNVTLRHAALSARGGSAILRTAMADGSELGGHSHIVVQECGGHRHETVPTVALDDIVPENREVAFLHLDVEEHEQKALRGARRLLARCKPLLALETMPKNEAFLAEHVRSLGYREIGTVHRNSVLTAVDNAPEAWERCRDPQS